MVYHSVTLHNVVRHTNVEDHLHAITLGNTTAKKRYEQHSYYYIAKVMYYISEEDSSDCGWLSIMSACWGGDLGFPFKKYEIAISGQNSNYCTFYF